MLSSNFFITGDGCDRSARRSGPGPELPGASDRPTPIPEGRGSRAVPERHREAVPADQRRVRPVDDSAISRA